MDSDLTTFGGIPQDALTTFRTVQRDIRAPENGDMPSTARKLDTIAIEMGARLREARKAMGLTQHDLAKLTGWSDASSAAEARGLRPTRLGNFERGERRIGIEEARIFEAIFGQPAAYFLGIIDKQEAEVIAALRRVRN